MPDDGEGLISVREGFVAMGGAVMTSLLPTVLRLDCEEASS